MSTFSQSAPDEWTPIDAADYANFAKPLYEAMMITTKLSKTPTELDAFMQGLAKHAILANLNSSKPCKKLWPPCYRIFPDHRIPPGTHSRADD